MSTSRITLKIVNSQSLLYPTYEELQRSDVFPYPTRDTARLFWSFNGGSLETSLSVMASAYNTDVLEPYFQQTADGAPAWHAISQSSLVHPPVSEIRATSDILNIWESEWLDCHRGHTDPDQFPESEDSEDPPWGELSDYDPEQDEEPPHLLVCKCCDSDRPRHKSEGVLVTASLSGPGFVTIHDYIMTVYPWLMRSRDDIFEAMDVWDSSPDPEDMDLVVDLANPNSLTIEEKSTWLWSLSMRAPGWSKIHDRQDPIVFDESQVCE